MNKYLESASLWQRSGRHLCVQHLDSARWRHVMELLLSLFFRHRN